MLKPFVCWPWRAPPPPPYLQSIYIACRNPQIPNMYSTKTHTDTSCQLQKDIWKHLWPAQWMHCTASVIYVAPRDRRPLGMQISLWREEGLCVGWHSACRQAEIQNMVWHKRVFLALITMSWDCLHFKAIRTWEEDIVWKKTWRLHLVTAKRWQRLITFLWHIFLKEQHGLPYLHWIFFTSLGFTLCIGVACI